jgi:hypothetical protein
MDSFLYLVEAIPSKLDAIVQLARNGLCCVKDLKAFPLLGIHDASVTARYYEFPEPLNQTTPLEICIAICQFYAFVSVSKAGYGLITNSGLYKLRRVERVMGLCSKLGSGGGVTGRIIDQSLAKEKGDAYRCIFVGANVLAIGLSFFWLVANSLHVTQTNWIGGLPGLIHALTVMEVALVPLLWFMIKDGTAHILRSSRVTEFNDDLAAALASEKDQDRKDSLDIMLDYESYCWLRTGGWSPFWEKPADSPRGGKKVAAEEDYLLTKVVNETSSFVGALASGSEDDKNSKAARREADDACEGRLKGVAVETRWSGYLEYIYFALNFIAFYGYMLGILTYYFDDDSLLETYTGSLRLGMNNADADWSGNFAGDLMWTIEPVVILANPMLIGWLKPKTAKVKTE